MSDLIDRQAAIDAILQRDANCGIDNAEVLKSLPSAQPERRTATWIEDSDPGEEIGMYWACSNCKHGIGGVTHSEMIAMYHFCPNCGADMSGGEANETD